MALHFIVDGYNVIRKTPSLDHEKLADARQALLAFIDVHRPQGSASNKITVVFDSKESFSAFQYVSEARVVFTKGESADDYIISFVEKSSNAPTIMVVSDDKELIRCCRSRGAHPVSVNEFMASAKKMTHAKQKKTEGFFELPYMERKKINEELAKLWLTPKGEQ